MRTHGLWRPPTVVALIAMVLGALGASAPIARASGNSVTVSIGSPPTSYLPTAIDVSGVATSGEQLYMYVDWQWIEGCQATPSGEQSLPSVTALNYGVPVDGGFNLNYAYTSSSYGESWYLVCAYIDDVPSDPPVATTSGMFFPSLPSASVSLSLPSSGTQNVPMSITATGTTQTSQRLYLVVDSNPADGCHGPVSGEQRRSSMTPLNTGDAISAGSFSRSYSFTPQSTGMFLVCGYVALPSGWPLATQSEMFDVGQAAAAITLSTGAKLAAGIPAAITAAGSTQVARKVWVFVDSDSRDICASDPEDESALTSADRLDHGDAISAGTYSKTYRYTADHPGSYLVCGYVAGSDIGTMDASTETIIHATTPAATVKVSAAHTAPIGHQQVLTVSGTSARQQLLDVVVCLSSGSCSRISSTTGTALEDLTVNGSFTKTFKFTPHRFGRYTVTAKVLYMGQSAPANFPTSASSSRSFNVPPTRQAGRAPYEDPSTLS